MDSALRAAIGYMMPEGEDVTYAIVELQERVAEEASAASQATIVEWSGSTKLKRGFGEMVATVKRVGAVEEWTISRRQGAKDWPIIKWTEMQIESD